MFDIEFLRKYPQFGVCEGVQLTLLPPRMRAKPLDEVIRDDEELDTRIKSEKKKIPESPESVVFAKAYLPAHVWFELPMGNDIVVQVQDLVPEDYPLVLQFMMEHFLPVEPLCKSMRLQDDEEGIKECIREIAYYMGCSTSLVAVDGQKRLIGALIGKIEDIDECSEKTFNKNVFSSKRLQTMFSMIKFILKTVNMHERYNIRMYYRIYHMAVHRGWQNKGVEKALITAALKLCSIFKICRIAGLFTLYKDQYYMKQFGGKTELEVYFSEWRTDRGLRIFRGTGKTEPKIACISAPVPESFLTSAEEAPPFLPLSSERARRFIGKRLHLWDELDIYRNGFEPPNKTFEKKSDGPVLTATIGNVDIGDLTTEDKDFFISKTYKTTYDDYAKTVPTGQSALKQPFCRLDDQMLLVLNANKPDLAYYGFGLPNKCCMAWGTAQSRTLPSEHRDVVKRKLSYNFGRVGYPEKMYPYISKGELSPHYDGSFVFGYTGHQRHPDIHDYPENISGILRRDFPMHIPRNLTTNQANLIHKPIPECEKREQISKETK